MNSLSKDSASWREVDESSQDQRIDNYLLKKSFTALGAVSIENQARI